MIGNLKEGKGAGHEGLRGKWERSQAKALGQERVWGVPGIASRPVKKQNLENKIKGSKRNGSKEQFYIFYARLQFHKVRAQAK